ncbi:hypothetical protein GCM10007298_13650 [Williamsia phyllosphaerae]|uniref:Ester cyclase n=1 Tax=Williamsia phyllosphaerae TaxID=885042 RepID=A0ABQ1UK59_9NOCA|nr:hypothetical protein GCM10007298_13650 [Williamsia phyllosphaerae]
MLIALIAVVASACSSHPAAPPDPHSLIDRTPGLVRPASVHVASTDTDRDRAVVHVAQQLYTFWNTGDTARLDAAVGPEFRDNTLPSGRPQGPTGPVAASSTFRAAIPDLTCELADLYVTGDTFTARLVFAGTFTGTYNGVRGAGQPIRFGAIDIQHVGTAGKIVEDWHLEDNLTFLQQAGLVTVASAPARN